MISVCVFSCKTQQLSVPEYGKKELKKIFRLKKFIISERSEILKMLMEEP
jgi:hypothetical protein